MIKGSGFSGLVTADPGFPAAAFAGSQHRSAAGFHAGHGTEVRRCA